MVQGFLQEGVPGIPQARPGSPRHTEQAQNGYNIKFTLKSFTSYSSVCKLIWHGHAEQTQHLCRPLFPARPRDLDSGRDCGHVMQKIPKYEFSQNSAASLKDLEG